MLLTQGQFNGVLMIHFTLIFDLSFLFFVSIVYEEWNKTHCESFDGLGRSFNFQVACLTDL